MPAWTLSAFGATLEQEQDDHTLRPIVFTRGATVDSEGHQIPLDPEAGSDVWSTESLHGHL